MECLIGMEWNGMFLSLSKTGDDKYKRRWKKGKKKKSNKKEKIS